jgi:dihydrofolate reductase
MTAKVIITAQMSVDASIGPEIGWYAPGGEHEQVAENDVRLADAMLLGRKTYESLTPIWESTSGEFAEHVNAMPKYVASTSLTGPLEWNASLIEGDLAAEVNRLKARHTGALVAHGCGEFAFNLVKLGLVDEVRFWVHPVVWNEPDRPFHGLGHVRMNLKDCTVFRNGVTLQTYEPVSVD